MADDRCSFLQHTGKMAQGQVSHRTADSYPFIFEKVPNQRKAKALCVNVISGS